MKKILGLMLAVVNVSSLGLADFTAMPQEFSAEITSTTPQGAMTMKLYTSGGKSRVEMAQQTVITRRDLQIMWMIMPAQGMFMEQPLDLRMAAQTSFQREGEVERTLVGPETIDGKACQKYKVVNEEKGVRVVSYQWIGADNFPVRMQAEDGSWAVDYRNVVIGPQSAALFEEPTQYQKMTIPTMGQYVS